MTSSWQCRDGTRIAAPAIVTIRPSLLRRQTHLNKRNIETSLYSNVKYFLFQLDVAIPWEQQRGIVTERERKPRWKLFRYCPHCSRYDKDPQIDVKETLWSAGLMSNWDRFRRYFNLWEVAIIMIISRPDAVNDEKRLSLGTRSNFSAWTHIPQRNYLAVGS